MYMYVCVYIYIYIYIHKDSDTDLRIFTVHLRTLSNDIEHLNNLQMQG